MSLRTGINNLFTQLKDKVSEELSKTKVTITVGDANSLKIVQQTLDKFGTKYTTIDKTVTIKFE